MPFKVYYAKILAEKPVFLRFFKSRIFISNCPPYAELLRITLNAQRFT